MKKIARLFILLSSFQPNIFSGPNFSKILDAVLDDTVDSLTRKNSYTYQDDDFDQEIISFEEAFDSSLDLFSLCIEAINGNEIEVVKGILAEQPDIVDQQDELGLTPLHHALISQDDDNKYKMNEHIVSILINNGADTEIEDNEGISPRSLVEIYKKEIEKDFTATSDDYNRVTKIYGSVSPDRNQFIRKRFAN
jgi:ankyrin repeat protein